MSQFTRKLASSASRVAVVETLNHYYDALFIPAIALWGPIVGGGIMTIGAIILNRIFIHAYNKSSLDWYGFEWIRLKVELAIGVKKALIIMAISPYFIFWCWWDPFAGFIFIRGKRPTGSFGWLDWVLLTCITTLGAIIWTAMIQGAIEFLMHLFGH